MVYDRKPHLFTYCDLYRISQKMRLPSTDRQRLCKLQTEIEILKSISDLPTDELRLARDSLISEIDRQAAEFYNRDEFSAFGGGAFSGAGADRTWLERVLKPFEVPEERNGEDN